MTQWKYPKINQPSNLLDVTDEMLLLWEKENKECFEYNKNIRNNLEEIRRKMMSDAEIIWGKNSNVSKYLWKQRIYMPELFNFSNVKSRVLKAREDEKERLQNIEREQKLQELQGKAIEFLINRNKIINVDFTIDTAISEANDISYREEVYRRQKELLETHTFIDFNGNNCEDRPCRGWDGSSRRCDCGNRRVSWSSHDNGDFFLNPYIYGEAY